MKFRKIEIRPTLINGSDSWEINIHRLDETEREKRDNGPHSMGFYYCPETKSIEQGFLELKQALIKNHEEEIYRLTLSLESLKQVTLNLGETGYF